MPSVPINDIRLDESFAQRLPAPRKLEHQALVEDIRRRGVLVELLITKDRLLLDGHRRLAAAKEVGLAEVPATQLDLDGRAGWEKTVALAVNLFRRHLTEAQRANLGSSLLRIERADAKERQRLGQEHGRENRGTLVLGNGSPQPKRATERAAEAVGVSRKTLERVEAVKRKDPLLAKRMIDGKLSVSSAYRKVKVEELRKHAAAEVSADDTLVTDLQAVLGKYRTVYLDPPWRYEDSGVRGAAEGHYPTMSVKELVALPVPKLAHNDGAHFWVWTTWPLLREATPHDLLRAWGLRWVGEILWDKETLGTGHYTRSRTEVLILAVKGALPLLSDCVNPLVNVKRGMHSEKPAEFAKLISDLSPGPRIELFARRAREGWDRWGLEA